MLLVASAVTAASFAAASAASTGCTLSGTLPSKININKSDVIFYSTLKATRACYGYGHPDASAHFDGPEGLSDDPMWDNFGDRYRFDQFAYATKPGTYKLEDFDALLFDDDFNQIPVHSKTTTTSIRFGSYISKLTTTRTQTTHVTVSSRVHRYTDQDEYSGYRTTVRLQRRAKGATWRPFKKFTSSSTGLVTYSYRTTHKYHYRMVVAATSSVWGSTSRSVYR
jgi:hypothetical protein